jgi:hypothetical protein
MEVNPKRQQTTFVKKFDSQRHLKREKIKARGDGLVSTDD